MHINEPINENSSHIFIDSSILTFHILGVRDCFSFVSLHVLCDFTYELRDVVDVVQSLTVYFADVFSQMTVKLMLIRCHFVLKTDFWEAVSRADGSLIELGADQS